CHVLTGGDSKARNATHQNDFGRSRSSDIAIGGFERCWTEDLGPNLGGLCWRICESSLGNYTSHAPSTCSKPRSIFRTPSGVRRGRPGSGGTPQTSLCYPGCSSRGGVESKWLGVTR